MRKGSAEWEGGKQKGGRNQGWSGFGSRVSAMVLPIGPKSTALLDKVSKCWSANRAEPVLKLALLVFRGFEEVIRVRWSDLQRGPRVPFRVVPTSVAVFRLLLIVQQDYVGTQQVFHSLRGLQHFQTELLRVVPELGSIPTLKPTWKSSFPIPKSRRYLGIRIAAFATARWSLSISQVLWSIPHPTKVPFERLSKTLLPLPHLSALKQPFSPTKCNATVSLSRIPRVPRLFVEATEQLRPFWPIWQRWKQVASPIAIARRLYRVVDRVIGAIHPAGRERASERGMSAPASVCAHARYRNHSAHRAARRRHLVIFQSSFPAAFRGHRWYMKDSSYVVVPRRRDRRISYLQSSKTRFLAVEDFSTRTSSHHELD